jgi:hypothetical protein
MQLRVCGTIYSTVFRRGQVVYCKVRNYSYHTFKNKITIMVPFVYMIGYVPVTEEGDEGKGDDECQVEPRVEDISQT